MLGMLFTILLIGIAVIAVAAFASAYVLEITLFIPADMFIGVTTFPKELSEWCMRGSFEIMVAKMTAVAIVMLCFLVIIGLLSDYSAFWVSASFFASMITPILTALQKNKVPSFSKLFIFMGIAFLVGGLMGVGIREKLWKNPKTIFAFQIIGAVLAAFVSFVAVGDIVYIVDTEMKNMEIYAGELLPYMINKGLLVAVPIAALGIVFAVYYKIKTISLGA